mgnify:CR=1 FL=1
MSFISNVYMIKTLEQPKGLSVQESKKYRNISESTIYESCFEENFGQNAFIYSEDLQKTENLDKANDELLAVLKEFISEKPKDNTFCKIVDNTIVISKDYFKKYKQEKISQLKTAVSKLTEKNYEQTKYELQNILNSSDCYVFPAKNDDSSFIQSVDKWIEYCLDRNNNTIIQVVGTFEVKE